MVGAGSTPKRTTLRFSGVSTCSTVGRQDPVLRAVRRCRFECVGESEGFGSSPAVRSQGQLHGLSVLGLATCRTQCQGLTITPSRTT